MRLHGHSHEVACLAEAAVGCCRGGRSAADRDDDAIALVSVRMREELGGVQAADVLQALAAAGAGLTPITEDQLQQQQQPQQQLGGLQAKRVASLAARQQEALCGLVDAAALQMAVDHGWMQATHEAWGQLAHACILQHQAEQRPDYVAPEHPTVQTQFSLLPLSCSLSESSYQLLPTAAVSTVCEPSVISVG